MTAQLVLAHNRFTINISRMDELILLMHLLCILFFFIDNENIKFRTKTDHIFQMNGVCAHEVCVLSSLAPNLHSDILSRCP